MSSLNTLRFKEVINAQGTLTLWGGCRAHPEAAAAMAEVAGLFIDYKAYIHAAGEHIAELLNVEAAMATSGAAAAMLQATAACLAGLNPGKRQQLPSQSAKHEVIILRSHRTPYDQAVRAAGATLVEIGSSIETHVWELEEAISDATAAVVFFLQGEMLESSLRLPMVLEVTRKANIPLIVNAAAELPPKANLWSLAQLGCDFVIFSGGKDIRGPQASGLIVGRKACIEAIHFHSAPNQGIARIAKVGKEAVAGLVRALEVYLEEDEEERFRTWERLADHMARALTQVPGLHVTRYRPSQPRIQPPHIPRLQIRPKQESQLTTGEIVARLRKWDPPIIVDATPSAFFVNLHTLSETETEIVSSAITQIMERGA